MKKMKRMSISEIEDTFSIIDKREQIMYVGQGRWTIKNDGSFEYFDDGNNSYDTLVSEDNSYSIALPFGTINNSHNYNLSEATAKEMFGFIATHSKVEWGMTIRNDGKAKIYTNHNDETVTLMFSSDAKQVIHSHVHSGSLSPEDKNNAREHSNIKHTLFYNGSYNDYGYGGFYGDPY